MDPASDPVGRRGAAEVDVDLAGEGKGEVGRRGEGEGRGGAMTGR